MSTRRTLMAVAGLATLFLVGGLAGSPAHARPATQPTATFGATRITLHAAGEPLHDVLRRLPADPSAPVLRPPPEELAARRVTIHADLQPWLAVVSQIAEQAEATLVMHARTGEFALKPRKAQPTRPAPASLVDGVLLRCEGFQSSTRLAYGTPNAVRRSTICNLTLLAEPAANIFAIDDQLESASARGTDGKPVANLPRRAGRQLAPADLAYFIDRSDVNAPAVAELELAVGLLVAEQWHDLTITDPLSEPKPAHALPDGRQFAVSDVKVRRGAGYRITLACPDPRLPPLVAANLGGAWGPFAIVVRDEKGRTLSSTTLFRPKGEKLEIDLDVEVAQREPKLTVHWRVPTVVRREVVRLKINTEQP